MAQRVNIGKITELEDGEITAINVEQQQIAIARIGNEVFALEDRCSHKECALSEGLIENRTVICPCHGSEFDLRTGEALALPAKTPVESFGIEIDGEDVYVQTN